MRGGVRIEVEKGRGESDENEDKVLWSNVGISAAGRGEREEKRLTRTGSSRKTLGPSLRAAQTRVIASCREDHEERSATRWMHEVRA